MGKVGGGGSKPIGRLAEGPLDVIGDIHGEWGALRQLLNHLGYDQYGEHPSGRTLVFIGDLCDRGPDSPEVFSFVRRLVSSGAAQCVIGNHELNLLRRSAKEGNGWFFDHDHDLAKGKFQDSQRARPEDRQAILDFLDSLPLALENDELRAVHACWHDEKISQVQGAATAGSVIQLYDHFEFATEAELATTGLNERASAEEQKYLEAIEDPDARVPMLPALAEKDERYQMGNPLRVLTSGVERRTAQPFFSSGKWRFVERIPWWNEYQEKKPVVIGHYWRWAEPIKRKVYGKGGPDLFAGLPANAWFGQRQNVFCVDFSVGQRFSERAKGRSDFKTKLAALRWPERVVQFDDGQCVGTTAGL